MPFAIKKAYHALTQHRLQLGSCLLFTLLLSACSGGSDDTSGSASVPIIANTPHTTQGFILIGEQQSVSGQLLRDIQGNAFVLNSNLLVSGRYGELTVTTEGEWLYSLDTNAAGLITKGESVEDILLIYDDATLLQTITIVINSVDVLERSVIFIAVNFKDDLVVDEINEFALEDLFFNDIDSVDKLYQANSLGQIKFIRDRDNDSRLDYFTSTINYLVADENCAGTPAGQAWADAADEVLRRQSVQVNEWDHRVYLFPGATAESCDYAGQAPIDCRPGFCWAYINAHTKAIIAHELGHNFGLGHSGTDRNNDGDTDDTDEDEYGDGGAIMGSFAGSRTIEAPHRDLIDWYVDYSEYTATLTATGSMTIQTIQHTASELVNNGLPQLLRVSNPSPGPNQARYYYVSYHQWHETSNSLPFHDERVKIHYLSETAPAPGSSHRVASLRMGQSFNDAFTGLNIRVDEMTDGAATISVTYD